MYLLKLTLASAVLSVFSSGAFAASNSTSCSDSYGGISVTDGNVTIKDGIGDVGAASTQKIIKDIAEKTEHCVEGQNYVWTKVTVQEVAYKIEENTNLEKAIVLCSQVQTGIDTSCK